jgi:hypothetical protein
MEIGIALPTMANGFTRSTFVEWCTGIDEGPYSSISAGERITFHNPELLVTNTAAAALTERVQVITNIAVLPLHRPAMLAKQLATLDVLATGRLVVGVGVGGRWQDYRSLDVPFEGRHERLDAGVAELRRLWSGGSAYEGGQPVGPAPHSPGGPPLWAAAMGPKSMARAAKWADGMTGFSIGADPDEIARCNGMALEAWEAEGRSERPRLVSGSYGRAVQPGPVAGLVGRCQSSRLRRVHPGAGHCRPGLPGPDHGGAHRLSPGARSRSPRPSRRRMPTGGSPGYGPGRRPPAQVR